MNSRVVFKKDMPDSFWCLLVQRELELTIPPVTARTETGSRPVSSFASCFDPTPHCIPCLSSTVRHIGEYQIINYGWILYFMLKKHQFVCFNSSTYFSIFFFTRFALPGIHFSLPPFTRQTPFRSLNAHYN